MIIARLYGGLGNQLFQYATAKAVAESLGVELKVDISLYSGPMAEPDRRFELGNFRCNPSIASEDEIQVRADPRLYYLHAFGHLKQPMLNGYESFSHYVEPDPGFNVDIFKVSNEHCLEGYFQSPKYFEHTRERLVEDFESLKPIPLQSQEVLHRIQNCDAICLHVRRGDYVSNSYINSAFGVCTPTYYDEAVRIMLSRLSHPQIFVFSDDTAWCAANLKFDVPMHVIDCNDGDAILDFHLMTRCKNFISANSTYSWWAAWLGSDAESVVICPRKYFAGMTLSTEDLIPEKWLRVEAFV